jgi:hypothetical protein
VSIVRVTLPACCSANRPVSSPSSLTWWMHSGTAFWRAQSATGEVVVQDPLIVDSSIFLLK